MKSDSPEQKQAAAAYMKDWYARNRRTATGYKLQREYGISIETYETMLVAQGGVCAICKKACATGRALAVDHDHVTKEVRGLLCANCNNGLGRFNDSPALLREAANYIPQPEFCWEVFV